MKNFKRVLSLALAALMVIGGLVIAPVDAKAATADHVVIHEIFGANGKAYSSDYVILYNPTNASVDLNGWSIQYTAAKSDISGSTNITKLSGTIAANQYYLIQLSTSDTGTAIPVTASCKGSLNLSGTKGVVVLAKQATVVSGKDDANLVDLVGFGADSSTTKTYEGSAPATAPSNTTCIVRKELGVDTNDNKNDFETVELTETHFAKYEGKVAAPATPTYETTAEAMAAAVALANNGTLGEQNVEGVISKINYAYSAYQENMTLVITVNGYDNNPITCNYLKGECLNSLLVGDTIKVNGILGKDANGVLNMSGCKVTNYTPATGHTAVPDLTDPTPEQIVNAAYALGAGQSLKDDWAVDAIIVGEIKSSDSKYTFSIQIGDLTEKTILVYNVKNAKTGVDLSTLKTGDTINVSGTWTNYTNADGVSTIEITSGYVNSHTPKVDGAGSGDGNNDTGNNDAGNDKEDTVTPAGDMSGTVVYLLIAGLAFVVVGFANKKRFA